MMKLNYIAIDFETANYNKNSACQVGLVRFENGIEVESVSSLIKPVDLYFVPEFTDDIHGLSYDDVKNSPSFPEVWKNIILPFINKEPVPLVAHNANFDMNVIKECCSYYGLELPNLSYFDSLAIARNIWPELESHRLTDLGSHFEIKYKAHDALEDSRTCGKIVNLAAEETQQTDLIQLLNKSKVELCWL